MKIRFIWPGKTREEHARELLAEYLKRLTRFARCEVSEVREVAASDSSNVEKESRRILARMGDVARIEVAVAQPPVDDARR